MMATRLARPVSSAHLAATQAELKKQNPSARWPSLSSCPAWWPGGRTSANAASHEGRGRTPSDHRVCRLKDAARGKARRLIGCWGVEDAARTIRLAQLAVVGVSRDSRGDTAHFLHMAWCVGSQQLHVCRCPAAPKRAPLSKAALLELLKGALQALRLLDVRPVVSVTQHLLVEEESHSAVCGPQVAWRLAWTRLGGCDLGTIRVSRRGMTPHRLPTARRRIRVAGQSKTGINLVVGCVIQAPLSQVIGQFGNSPHHLLRTPQPTRANLRLSSARDLDSTRSTIVATTSAARAWHRGSPMFGCGAIPRYPFCDFPVGTHFGRLDPLGRAWDAACRRQPPPSSSSWSARDRPWPRRRRPTRP
eukprot:scaffold32690_cov107-Isochrysis_galbana.AAC.6